ncbi:hypothetical protein IGI04_009664 [Brassica rapa subsp. trilocularis]|uniref:Uncharacterized protein n=3 Tax=Brassica TaxID=3705 RepID=A0A0D3B2C9_BRAOL|nr:hypothetical protein IGI04_009664 [Brassica rapa subsp. trilocularis]VDC87194.1 unnamed protein product [Brassica oleracea]VDC87198.1 unnamed protein product [Brassica oleracea]
MAQKVCMIMMTLIMIGCHLKACSGMENMSKEGHLTTMETIRPDDVPNPVCIRNCSVTSHSKKEFQDCIIHCG